MANFESSGDPLTGTITGTDGDDTYVGRYLGDSAGRAGKSEIKLVGVLAGDVDGSWAG